MDALVHSAAFVLNIFLSLSIVGRVTLAAGGIALLAWFLRAPTSQLKYPPGPKGIPLLGNLLQLTPDVWFKFTEWKQVYGKPEALHIDRYHIDFIHLNFNVTGPIMYLNLAGQNVVVLNTLSVAADLLDRRAAIYSSRPKFIVAREMLTEGLFFVFQGHHSL